MDLVFCRRLGNGMRWLCRLLWWWLKCGSCDDGLESGGLKYG